MQQTTRRSPAGGQLFPLAIGNAALTFDHTDDSERVISVVDAALEAGVRTFRFSDGLVLAGSAGLVEDVNHIGGVPRPLGVAVSVGMSS